MHFAVVKRGEQRSTNAMKLSLGGWIIRKCSERDLFD